jgi:DNA-binding response OmpR family regulator
MFMNPLKLKVLAFGNKIMLSRLLSQVEEDEVSIIGCEEFSETLDKMNAEQFDLIIVDCFAENAGQVCQNAFHNTLMPVAALIQEKYADWNTLRKLEVDGYIPDDKGSDELMARIRAYSRRYAAVPHT